MRPRRAARRLLDPWAGLLYAVLIVLGVVILVATPTPWRMVGGPQAPVTLLSVPPSDIAAFVLAGPASAPCTAAVWLHVDHEPAEVTVVMVPPRTRCVVAGGGYAPIRRLVTDLGPKTASDALGEALGVSFDGWTTLDGAAVGRLLAAARAPGGGRKGLLEFRSAVAAFATAPRDLDDLWRQHDALARCLRSVPYDELTSNAVVNYVLGSDEVDTDLDLRAVSAAVRTFGALRARNVAVRTAASIVETCGTVSSWRLDESRLGPLRLSLALDLAAPAAPPRVTTRGVAAEVLVAVPPGVDAEPFARELHDALVLNGAGPHVVRSVPVGGESAGERLAAMTARRRPLAVVLAPWVAIFGRDPATTSDGATTGSTPQASGWATDGALADELQDEAEALRRAWQPAVLIAPPAGASDELLDAASASELPLVDPVPGDWPASAAGDASFWSTRLIAAAVARACWPAYLAPGLVGTELEFSYAARRETEVAIAGDTPDALTGDTPAALSAWLPACGYDVVGAAGAAGRAPGGDAIVYRPGARRPALALAGDIGWAPATLIRDAAAPATLTVITASD